MTRMLRWLLLCTSLLLSSMALAAEDFPGTRVLFESGQATVPAEADLKPVLDFLAAHPDAKVLLSGFVDATGSPEANQALARQRALAVAAALKAAGLDEERIVLQKPDDVTAGEGEQARRVEITLAVPEAAPAPVIDKGDTMWMMLSTLMVILMAVPGLALFYGGLVRAKNMLSVLMQVFVTFSLIVVLWAVYGYSLAFTEGNAFIGGFDRLFMKGLWDHVAGTFVPAATFSKGVYIPEIVFAAFQATFAGITCCLIVGAFAERARFAAVLLFMVLWFTFSYAPIAHMVWYWMGPDAYASADVVDAMNAKAGFIWQMGALDFAGGTVVHINAAVAGLVGAWLFGPRMGYGKELMAPHNLPLTMVGSGLLWVGWFGFNAGSALEANGVAALAFINTLLATAAAVLAWCLGEVLVKGRASMLGAASGAVAGLVAITPAAGNVGLGGALLIGLLAGLVCLWGVTGLKKLLGADDSLDVFGVHGVGGILGALLTGVFNAPGLGGPGFVTDWVSVSIIAPEAYSIASQVWIQAKAVLITVVWSGVVSFLAFKVADLVFGLRVSTESEREGLDLHAHGEVAYQD